MRIGEGDGKKSVRASRMKEYLPSETFSSYP